MNNPIRNSLCLLLSVPLLGLMGCPAPLPPTTDNGGWTLETTYTAQTGPISIPAPGTTVTGVWLADGSGAGGDASEWVHTTGPDAQVPILNGRVPATWNLVWNASQSYPICDGVSATGTPSYAGVVEEFGCFYTETTEAEPTTFVYSPAPINLNSPPGTSTITGAGFSSDYGMPVVQYFDSNGTLVAQARAATISPNHTLITAPTPDLSQVSVGTYSGVISNIASNGSYVYLGASSVRVDKPPVKCTPKTC